MTQLLTDIEAFCKRHDMKPSRFGELALNDKPFVFQIRRNRRVWPETESKVREWMATFEQDAAA